LVNSIFVYVRGGIKPVLDINGRKKEWQNDDEPRTKYALETDWLAEAAGFEPLHLEIRIC
jgi:hypothetical protein